ncbi:ImcF-related family protein [Gemmobacter caeruleus]|uniref:ImcF-related family protein n=1 Tax=Gemmobacter caeruleus TaxID=2595004 RepID=UPI0011EE95F5|nr:ImcF-related family protein [Gemmobacter caeruleus]
MAAGPEVYQRLADPVLAYADRLADVRGERLGDLLRHATVLLDRFGSGLQRAGVPGPAVLPARLALGLVLDHEARANREIDPALWGEGARRLLFEGRTVALADIAEYQRRAAGAGPDYVGAAGFLAACLARLEGARRHYDSGPVTTNWTGILLVLISAYVLAILGWGAWVEWRFHRDLAAAFDAQALATGLDRDGSFVDLAARLDALAAAADTTAATRARAPVNLFAHLAGYDAADRAQATYADALARHLPPLLARALDDALAREGEPVAAYDTLRAHAVLSGATEWQPDWLAGWTAARVAEDAALRGLAPHVARLAPPATAPPAPDAELLAQARILAAEAPEPDRAYLELNRAAATAAPPDWRPDQAVPGLSAVLRRKSDLAFDTPIDGLFTDAGWAEARDFGAGLAVQAARDQAARLFPTPPPPQNDTPDILMDRLQQQTLAVWSGYLADLRVREFTTPDASVRISGELARRNSVLEQLLAQVWQQAGGRDRSRSHPQQLAIAAEFGPMIQYVEQGRMQEIAALFAGLNVALGAMDRTEETGQQRLMSAQDRGRSVATLGVAPTVVVQIVEDTLAQTGAAHADLLSNPLTQIWQAQVLETCLQATAGHFPFADSAEEAEPATLQHLFGPGGLIDRFVTGRAAEMLDTSATPWRWKPEARFEGLAPESAAFLQRAQAIGAGLFGKGDLRATLTLSALAERGRAFVTLGGTGGPVEATTEALRLDWPGPDPAAGIEARFTGAGGEARLTAPGLWGLLRLLAPLRLRERDGGQRFLIDLKAEDARLFLELQFDSPQNPLALRGLMRGLTCPPVL